jgi:hypothetical protein
LLDADLREEPVKVRIVAGIGLDADCSMADVSNRLFEDILATSGDVDARAFGCEKLSGCKANAAGGASYKGNFVLKSVGHLDLLSLAVRKGSARARPPVDYLVCSGGGLGA